MPYKTNNNGKKIDTFFPFTIPLTQNIQFKLFLSVNKDKFLSQMMRTIAYVLINLTWNG